MGRWIWMIGRGFATLVVALAMLLPWPAAAEREIDVVQCYCNGQYTVMPQGTNCRSWCVGSGYSNPGPPRIRQLTEEERAAQERGARRAAFNNAYAKYLEIAKNGFALSDRRNYAAAIDALRQAQSLMIPYIDEAYTTFVDTDLGLFFDDVRRYIGFAEAHLAEDRGDVDLAFKKMQLCGSLGTLCMNDEQRKYYMNLESKLATRRDFTKNKADTERILSDIGRKSDGSRRNYTRSDDALIGGTTWIAGYNVPANSAPELKKQAAAMLRQQMKLAGIPYNEAIDFTRYNFVLGIGASTNALVDLSSRVVLDNLSAGRATAEMQRAYAALKGRSFGELGCHSNGAMICLFALENRHIKAERVVLYGPQITPESLRMWEKLIKSGYVKSIQMYLNQNDPVPAVSMMFGAQSFSEGLSSVALFKSGAMSKVVRENSPSIKVKTFSCGGLVPTLDCHDLARYKAERGCRSMPPSGVRAPGTRLPGGEGVFEPPPPC